MPAPWIVVHSPGAARFRMEKASLLMAHFVQTTYMGSLQNLLETIRDLEGEMLRRAKIIGHSC